MPPKTANQHREVDTRPMMSAFKRILTIPESESDDHVWLNGHLPEIVRNRFAPKRYCFTTLQYLIRSSPQDCIFHIGGNATTIEHPVPSTRFRAIYEAVAFKIAKGETRNAYSIFKPKYDIDFKGTISRAGSEFCLDGEQSDGFAQLSSMAVVVDAKLYPELPLDGMPFFERIRLRNVNTVVRYPIEPTSLSPSAVCIGEGILGWNKDERRLDRYGYVQLWVDDCEGTDVVAIDGKQFVGTRGSLIAEIVEPTPMERLWGDETRRFFPQPVRVGETICLGRGLISMLSPNVIGCLPDDGREIDWLNPRALYMCRGHRVRLYLVPQV